jgi:UDP-N-acetylglucosamine 2-epimerase
MNKTSEDDILRYLCTIPKTKIKAGESLIELTAYNDIAMWWFVDIDFDGYINQLVKYISSKKALIEKRSLIDHLKKSSFLYFIYEFFASFLSRLNVKLYGSKRSYKENRILITAQNIEWRIIRDYFTKEFKKGDAFFDSIISTLRENNENEIITTSPLGYSISDLEVIIDKRRSQKDIIHKPFDIYWSLDVWKEGRKAKKYFSDLWKDLKNDDNFRKLLEYKNIIFDSLEKRLSYYFTTVFGRMVEYIEMAKRMIEEEKPDLILIVNELGDFERALVVAGKLNGVPTLSVQHGIITPTPGGYMYTHDEISPERSVKSPYCPIPDRTALYGHYHKDLLTKVSAYPEDSVVVTGQPRYDILYHANKIYDKEEFLKRYKINPNHKIVLWATQCHGLSNEENIKNFKAVFETMQNIKNATLIIKQHPGEGEKYTKMIEKYLSTYKISAVVTPKSSDTYELLFVCDLMMTKNSTTAMEAIALNKPVIVLNLSGEPDVVDYVEQGVALGVYKEDDLKPAIEKLLKDDAELAKNRGRYIEKYLYKIDGKATERVVNLIMQTIEESKRDRNERSV